MSRLGKKQLPKQVRTGGGDRVVLQGGANYTGIGGLREETSLISYTVGGASCGEWPNR